MVLKATCMKIKKQTLLKARNEKLIKRYYYLHDIERKRLDDVLAILSNDEFYLDTAYILRLIRENDHLLKQVKAAKPTAAKLSSFKFIDN